MIEILCGLEWCRRSRQHPGNGPRERCESPAASLRFNSVAQDNLKAYQDAMSAAHDGAKTIGEKVLLNTEANTKAAFDAAQAISRAENLARGGPP